MSSTCDDVLFTNPWHILFKVKCAKIYEKEKKDGFILILFRVQRIPFTPQNTLQQKQQKE
jgi:hypothetical protein